MDAQAWVALAAAAIAMMVAVGTVAYTIGANHATRRDLTEMGKKCDADSKEVWTQIYHIKDTYARRDDLAAHLLPLKEAINALREDLRSLTELLGQTE